MKYWISILAAAFLLCGCGQPHTDMSVSALYESETEESGQQLPGSFSENLLEESPRDYAVEISEPEEKTGELSQEESLPGEPSQEEPPQEETAGQFLLPGNRYARGTLSETEQIWYQDMEKILGDMEQNHELSPEALEQGLTVEDIDRIFQSVMLDHPEFFFVDGYSYNSYVRGDQVVKLEFSGNYNVDRDTALQKQQEILAAADRILAAAPVSGDDYDKVKYVYETLIRRTDYDSQAPDNQNIYSVLVGGLSVCQGYAKATQFLLNRLGVECTLVQGTVQEERHGWNLVKADGDYYYVDTTWGDASYKSAEEDNAAVVQDINYDYLCVTTRELLLTHTLDNPEAMPLCTATADNYYVREGAYFTEPDEEKLQLLFRQASPENSYLVTLKCADKACYDEILQSLIADGRIFELYPESGKSVAYVQNDKQLSLTFWMTNE